MTETTDIPRLVASAMSARFPSTRRHAAVPCVIGTIHIPSLTMTRTGASIVVLTMYL